MELHYQNTGSQWKLINIKNMFRILSGNDMVGFPSKNAFFNEINKVFLVMQAQLSFTASLVTLNFNMIRAW